MTSKEVKKALQAIDPKIRVTSLKGQRNNQAYVCYIQAWFTTTKELRKQALAIIYGSEFTANDDEWIAGNVRENHISISPEQWGRLLIA